MDKTVSPTGLFGSSVDGPEVIANYAPVLKLV